VVLLSNPANVLYEVVEKAQRGEGGLGPLQNKREIGIFKLGRKIVKLRQGLF